MFLTHRQYMRFLSGGMQNVAILGFLPGHLAAHIPTLSTDIRIDGDYARKIWEKHRLGHEALGLVQVMINSGWCIKTRPNNLDFLYVEASTGTPKYYVLGIKGARSGQELWLTTLHPTNERDLRRRLKRAQQGGGLIRTAPWP